MPERSDAHGVRVVNEPLRRIGRDNSLGRGTWMSLVEVFDHRELLGRLVSREVRAKYKNSSLGIVWSLMRPLAQLLIYYVAIGQFLGAARSIPDFAIFVFTGLTAWALYSEIVTAGTNSIVNNSGLVKKVYVPREIFPLAAVGASIFNFVVQFAILARSRRSCSDSRRCTPTWPTSRSASSSSSCSRPRSRSCCRR